MPRNIAICCDGTGNEIRKNQSIVLDFFRTQKNDDQQIAFYNPGVGTLSNNDAWSRFKNKSKLLAPELVNLSKHALTAYKKTSDKNDFNIAWRCREVVDTSSVSNHFTIGLLLKRTICAGKFTQPTTSKLD